MYYVSIPNNTIESNRDLLKLKNDLLKPLTMIKQLGSRKIAKRNGNDTVRKRLVLKARDLGNCRLRCFLRCGHVSHWFKYISFVSQNLKKNHMFLSAGCKIIVEKLPSVISGDAKEPLNRFCLFISKLPIIVLLCRRSPEKLNTNEVF